MRRRARWGIGVAAALLVAASPSAHAADAASDRATREAEARFAEGLSRVKRQDYEAARLSFAQAYAVLHRPLILWNLALAEEKTGHSLDALPHFRQVAREAANPADRANAQKHVDALQGQTARIDVQAPVGSAFVLDGADVVGAAPLAEPLEVMPGHHVVVAKMAAGASKTLELDTTAGQIAHLTFSTDAPSAVASASVAPFPAAAPTEAQPPAPLAEPPEPDKPFWTARTLSTVGLTGAAAVAVGFGVVFGLESQNSKSTVATYQTQYGTGACAARPTPTYCGAWNDAVNAQNRDATISNALYFAGGAFAVGAVISWFFWPKSAHGVAAWVMPEGGPGRAGVGAGGRF